RCRSWGWACPSRIPHGAACCRNRRPNMYVWRRGWSYSPASPSAWPFSAQICSATRCATSSIRGCATAAFRHAMTTTARERETGIPVPADISNQAPLLVVDGLRTFFDLRHGVVKAVDGVSFALGPHETLAIVGESGCGKSITALSLMRLVPDPPGRIAGGSIKLDGVDLLTLDEETMRGVRGKDIAM